MDDLTKAAIAEAEGYLTLGMFEEAWHFIEDLPPEWRMLLPIMRVRLRCALALKAWDIAETLAGFLSNGTQADCVYSAQVFQELATIHLKAGDEKRARILIKAAIQIHPEQRAAIIDDPALDGLF